MRADYDSRQAGQNPPSGFNGFCEEPTIVPMMIRRWAAQAGRCCPAHDGAAL